MYFLGIETATDACSVVLYQNKKLIALRYTDHPKAHSKYLTNFIQEVLLQGNTDITQLSGVVLSEGPGSYTGLRIGMSAAKGIAYALDIPLMLIPSTMVAAYSGACFLQETTGTILGVIDAPNKELFVQCFAMRTSVLTPLSAPKHITATENILALLGLGTETNQPVYLSGKGASKIKEFYEDNPNVRIIQTAIQDMQNIGTWITETYEKQNFADTELCEPLYIKDFSPTLKPKKNKTP